MAGISLMNANRFDDARRLYDDAIADARRRGARTTLGFLVTLRALLLVRMGDLASAETDARSALEPFGDEIAVVAPWLTTSLVDVLVERGELDSASRLVDEHGLAGDLPDLLQMYWVLDSVGKLRVAQGRFEEAVERLRDCGRRVSAWAAEVRNPGLLPWRTSLALALIAAGERDEARALAAEEAELARGFGVPRELGMALRAGALAEGGEVGVEMLREAVAELDRVPAQLELARARVDLGAALRRQGSRADAREPLRAGLDVAHRCGATALAARAHEELVATGARPRRLVRSGIDALTASERRVATMASEGLTNKELAQALFVTEKTVEGHLAGAYRKLDISSRSELPKALAGAPA
jgi:DNA-binding CsgD family transcriptional regulator/Flp pilus assembly protein TadD